MTSPIERVLDIHRWKSMGVSSVQCECGEILYGDGSLTQFPADEAFRAHVAAEIARAIAEEFPRPPTCRDHREVQHRDGKPPWCRACGWAHGHPATPARQITNEEDVL